MDLNGHLGIRDSKLTSEGLILAYQQPHHIKSTMEEEDCILNP